MADIYSLSASVNGEHISCMFECEMNAIQLAALLDGWSHASNVSVLDETASHRAGEYVTVWPPEADDE